MSRRDRSRFPRPRSPLTTFRPLDYARWAVTAFRALAAPHRYRVRRDAEGWPVIPGKLGQIEWHDGTDLAVYSGQPRLFARLWAVPGIRRWQVGDQEVRGLVRVGAFLAVAALIQARKRRPARPLTSDQALRLRAGSRIGVTSAA